MVFLSFGVVFLSFGVVCLYYSSLGNFVFDWFKQGCNVSYESVVKNRDLIPRYSQGKIRLPDD